jgi:hypothetical protein
MKLKITFTKAFSGFCKISDNKEKKFLIKPGQYFVIVEKTETSFLIKHETFFFTVPKESWIKGKFFLDNNISILYLEKINFIDQ